jgi:uncharacterized protein (TIGR00251 family)
LNTSFSKASPFAAARDGVRVRIRLTPRASANRLVGLVAESDGGVALKIMVTAAAEHGKANDALIALLARLWHLAKSDISIAAGAGDRRKTVHVAGAAAQLLPALAASVAGLATP